MNLWCLFLATVLLVAESSAYAQTSKDGPIAKLTHSLTALHNRHNAHLAELTTAAFSSDDPLIRLVGDGVVIDAVASDDANVLKSDLESLGMQEAVAFGRIVSGQLPISAIPAAAALASLRFAQPVVATTDIGTVTSQGDSAIRSNVARTMFGVDGSGVKVGVLSDSFNCRGGATTNIANNDLSPVAVLQEEAGCSSGTDEGRAMLQIVHDVAPGASLLFATGFNGTASFAANIQALAAAGAKVIVDDVILFTQPFFQDGIVAQTVNSVVAGGVAYFSAAGNRGRQSYESIFRPGDVFPADAIPSASGAPRFLGGTAHNFNPSGGKDHFQSITIPGQTTVTFSLQWDSPFFSVSGSPGTQNDVDIYLLNASATQVLRGETVNNLGGDAVELLTIQNTGTMPINLNLMIVKFAGADPGLIKYTWQGTATVNEFNTQSSTIFGHKNAAGAQTVGAAAYFSTPAFGVSPPLLNSFSSSGPTPILFDLAGNRLATPDPRADKPEIVAPDGADTTFFGTDTDGNGFPNFFGTSAAAPHAAAVAALLLHAKPTLTPAGVYGSLERTAIDMRAAGFDNDSGFGLIQADAAVADALTPLVAAVLPSSRSVQVGTPATAFATIINTGSVTATSCGMSRITNIPATFSYQTTNPATNQVTGSPNTPVAIAAGAAQSFVFALTPTGPISSTDVQLSFDCANSNPAAINSGLNTLLLSASPTPIPDIVALAATTTNDGIVNILGINATGAFAVATVNVGVSGNITASADTGSASLPVDISLCQTNPATGQCISGIGASVSTTINAGATPTFGIFVQGSGNVPFDPAGNRIFVRFKGAGDITRGSTSVAVRTQ
jgi:Subtilase family